MTGKRWSFLKEACHWSEELRVPGDVSRVSVSKCYVRQLSWPALMSVTHTHILKHRRTTRKLRVALI